MDTTTRIHVINDKGRQGWPYNEISGIFKLTPEDEAQYRNTGDLTGCVKLLASTHADSAFFKIMERNNLSIEDADKCFLKVIRKKSSMRGNETRPAYIIECKNPPILESIPDKTKQSASEDKEGTEELNKTSHTLTFHQDTKDTTADSWQSDARKIAAELYSENPKLTLRPLAKKVHQQFTKDKTKGRGGRELSEETIKKALIGITSKKQ